MQVVVCQLQAILRFVGTPGVDSDLRACVDGLNSAVAALERYVRRRP